MSFLEHTEGQQVSLKIGKANLVVLAEDYTSQDDYHHYYLSSRPVASYIVVGLCDNPVPYATDLDNAKVEGGRRIFGCTLWGELHALLSSFHLTKKITTLLMNAIR